MLGLTAGELIHGVKLAVIMAVLLVGLGHWAWTYRHKVYALSHCYLC